MTAILVATPMEENALAAFTTQQQARGVRVEYRPDLNVADAGGTPDAKIRALLPDYDGVVVGSVAISADTWKAWAAAKPNQKLAISRLGISTESLNVAAAEQLGIPVMNTPNSRIEPCANFLLYQALHSFMGAAVQPHTRAFDAGQFDDTQPLYLPNIQQARIAVLGSGPIAAATVDRLRPFLRDPELQVKIYSPHLDMSKAAGMGATIARSSEEAVQDADIVIVAAGNTHAVVFGEKELAAMRTWREAQPREHAYAPVLVGISRRMHYDMAAISGAMEQGALRAVSLDSRAIDFKGIKEEFPALENGHFTPGIAYRTLEAEQDAAKCALSSIADFLSEGKISNITRPDSEAALRGAARLQDQALRATPSSVRTRILPPNWREQIRAQESAPPSGRRH
ncbi:MAG: hypothetical protein K2Q12_10985 [Rickettsiales bacterium]|nr:hypothetical protein [Rickettsiales bacterium]